MTDEQLAKAERLRAAAWWGNVTYRKGYIQSAGLADALRCGHRQRRDRPRAGQGEVFREAARLLEAGGRLALADIVTDVQLPEGITCDVTLWAACIGGAMQVGDYVSAIEAAGLRVKRVKDNPQYQFISKNAQGATKKDGVKSVSIVATKE